MARLFSVSQFKTRAYGRASIKLAKFKGKAMIGSSPGSAARKAITFICRQNTEKKGCSKMVVQLKEVKVSIKNGKRTFVNVGGKLYNYTGEWDNKKRVIAFKNKTIEFKGTPTVASCNAVAGKIRNPLCKLLR
jgi:hypothetical protein